VTASLDPVPRIALAVTTIGRPALVDLLLSAARSETPPVAVAIANQSGASLRLPTVALPFPITVVPSSGGASAGRNHAVAALGDEADVLGFPNDDSLLPPHLLGAVRAAFGTSPAPAAVACALREPPGDRFVLPPPRTHLDRRSVWRAIEPAMFVRTDALRAAGGFDERLGTGARTPWASGEGTDLLLRIMKAGGTVVSRPDLHVLGPGERRDLSARAFVAKHRGYARGTGYVYRVHRYSLPACLRLVVAPLVKAAWLDPTLPLSLRLALARFLGRIEGLVGRPLPGSPQVAWLPGRRTQRGGASGTGA
jgi:hypothetical protein